MSSASAVLAFNTGVSTRVRIDPPPPKEKPPRVSRAVLLVVGVTVRLIAPDPDMRPGMAADVSFRFRAVSSRNFIVVPAIAVGEDRGGRFVFVVEPTGEGLGIVHRRDVTVGELTSDGLEVVSGLSDGDRVITAGVSKIQDGLTVRMDT